VVPARLRFNEDIRLSGALVLAATTELYLLPGNCSVTARTVQGMAHTRSEQAPAWPLVSDRSARRPSGVKRHFA
jgi:hypothetical protein